MITEVNRPTKENAMKISEAYSEAMRSLAAARNALQTVDELLASGETEAAAEHHSTVYSQDAISHIEKSISAKPENWMNTSAVRKS